MQNNSNDDYAFAMQLQQKYYSELIPKGKLNFDLLDKYPPRTKRVLLNSESFKTDVKKNDNSSDYYVAMKLQQKYDKGFRDDYEGKFIKLWYKL